jgi:hypothetical protein
VPEVYGNAPVGTVTAGGLTTSDTAFTVTPAIAFPAAAVAPGTFFRITDQALPMPTEIMQVTVCPGGTAAGQSWTVTRAYEGTTAVAHGANWTAEQLISAGTLTGLTGMSLQATTGSAGVALINGTQSVLSWTAPTDGNLHVISWSILLHVTSAETGGSMATGISGLYTSGNISSGGIGIGWSQFGGTATLPSGDTWAITQSTALTAGAAIAYAQIWGY